MEHYDKVIFRTPSASHVVACICLLAMLQFEVRLLPAQNILLPAQNIVPAQKTVNEKTSPPISLPLASEHFELALQRAQSDNGKLWGQSLQGPIIFVDPVTRFAVANQADADSKFTKQGQVWTTILNEETVIANHSAELSGTLWTMVLWDALPQSVYDRSRLLLHESFHRLQIKSGLPQHSPNNAHLETMDGRIWLRLELRALQQAMLEIGDRQKQAAIDAMTFRKYRHTLVGDASADEEMALESNEGLAEYTGFMLCGLPEPSINTEIAVALQTQENKPKYARSFAYATGPAVFRLLDEFRPDWKSNRVDCERASDVLTNVLKVVEPTKETAIELAQRYRIREVLISEQMRHDRQQAELARIKEMFDDGPVLRIETTSTFQFSFDPNQSTPLNDNRNIYRPLKASDVWGTLNAPDGAMINFDPPMSLIVPYSSTQTWELKTSPAYELFQQDDKTWKIRSKK